MLVMPRGAQGESAAEGGGGGAGLRGDRAPEEVGGPCWVWGGVWRGRVEGLRVGQIGGKTGVFGEDEPVGSLLPRGFI